MARNGEVKTFNLRSVLKNMTAAAFSACIAEACTIPMDTVKVRLQMQRILPHVDQSCECVETEKLGKNQIWPVTPKYNGIIGTTKVVV